MKYQIVWTEIAEDGLADVWLNSPDKVAVNSASDRIDRLLAVEPREAGESREGVDRILFVPPLLIRFRVDEEVGTVTVLACGPSRR